MEALLAFFGTKAALVGLSAATVGAAVFGPKLVDSLVSKGMGRVLEKALKPNTGDAKRDEKILTLVHAALDLAEYELPDRGSSERVKLSVSAYLAKFIPQKQADVIGALVQEAADKADDDLKASKGKVDGPAK